jgi:hypothetical protein
MRAIAAAAVIMLIFSLPAFGAKCRVQCIINEKGKSNVLTKWVPNANAADCKKRAQEIESKSHGDWTCTGKMAD